MKPITKRQRIPKDFKSHVVLKHKFYMMRVLVDGVWKKRYVFCQAYHNNHLGRYVVFAKRYRRKTKTYGSDILYMRSGSDYYTLWHDLLKDLPFILVNSQQRFVRVLKDFRDEGLMVTDYYDNLMPVKYLHEKFKIVSEESDCYTVSVSNKEYVVNKSDFEVTK